jgi:hypothetical protein
MGAGFFCPVRNEGIYAASTIHRRRDACPTFRAWRLGRPSTRPDALALGRAMVKETKFFRKQAAKAERMARSASDAEISQSFSNMATAYRSQADVLKAKKLKAKKKSGKKRR